VKTTRRSFLRIIGATAVGISTSCAAPPRRSTARPNIVFFLIDDQRNDTLGCAGHPILKTPVVDSLAAEGVRFANAFVTTSICAASRATIFTGLYERTHGFTFGTPPIRRDHALASYPALMRKAGYRTGFIGKFGVKAKDAGPEMFDYFKPHGRGPYHKKQPDGSLRHEAEIAADKAIEFLNTNPARHPNPTATPRRPGNLRFPARIPQKIHEPRPLVLAMGHTRKVPEEHPRIFPHDQRR